MNGRTSTPKASTAGLSLMLRELKLPSFHSQHEDAARRAENDSWSYTQYLQHLAATELEDRRQRRIARLRHQSELPSTKTLATLEVSRLPAKVGRQLPVLCEGGFVERSENVLAFGNPGTGKTHLACAIGHALVDQGVAVRFTPTFRLVQRLLEAKQRLTLDQELRRLDHFDVVVLDDIGYVQQSREEMEVLFTFLAERYERRSVIITSNLVFSQWDRIFKDTMTTAAAIDRLVHHAVILELTGSSYRTQQAKKRNTSAAPDGSEASS
jgi:DNA replication protein DnaC